jgi:hypothetical protein
MQNLKKCHKNCLLVSNRDLLICQNKAVLLKPGDISMKQWLLMSLIWVLAVGFSMPAQAYTVAIEATQLREDYPATYRVGKQDTLWDVTGVFLTTPWQQSGMWAEHIKVYPGDEVSVIREGGRAFLQLKHQREVKLSPQIRTPRNEPPPIEPIPISAIRQFLNKPQVVTEDLLENAPYIVQEAEGRLFMTEGNEIYVRDLRHARQGERYAIFRLGRHYNDDDGNSGVYEAIYLGQAQIIAADDELATAHIIDAEREIRAGDLLLELEEVRFSQDLQPKIPHSVEDAKIIAVVNGLAQIGQYQVVVIDKGRRDAIESGHIFGVYSGGGMVKDKVRPERGTVELPPRQAGTLLIFKVFDTVSYALVMSATRAIYVNDKLGLP